MGKAIVYTALVIVCLGIGLIVGGLGVYYGRPYYEPQPQSIQIIKAKCYPMANGGGPSIEGEISLSQTSNKHLVINALIDGLPKKELGFHIHSFGVVNNNCSSAGGHFNPEGKNHGGPNSMERHMGDLGNIDASKFPHKEVEITDKKASLFGKDSIIGRSIVIHEDTDDLKNQSSAGGRLACCTIIRVD
ncbi:Superoxide dismutase [Cu-Zn] [Armadillidium nasatum]|uniref:Superoxide dismutase [Cu-Zn] n=1 Tax=Armadillidium nasatum TaxID=96803 RepID=A0A5N5TPI5_9CRUS|nr:Superoxide dismutase [Cu-Zn] [Armadillidium nasatum]